jgi:hypothetical protein
VINEGYVQQAMGGTKGDASKISDILYYPAKSSEEEMEYFQKFISYIVENIDEEDLSGITGVATKKTKGKSNMVIKFMTYEEYQKFTLACGEWLKQGDLWDDSDGIVFKGPLSEYSVKPLDFKKIRNLKDIPEADVVFIGNIGIKEVPETIPERKSRLITCIRKFEDLIDL